MIDGTLSARRPSMQVDIVSLSLRKLISGMHEIKAPGFEPCDAFAPDSKNHPLSLLRNLHTFSNVCTNIIYDFYKKRNRNL